LRKFLLYHKLKLELGSLIGYIRKNFTYSDWRTNPILYIKLTCK